MLDLLACHGSLKLLSFGRLMGNRIAVMRGGVCIPAYLVNPAGAKVILDAGRFAADRRLGPVTDFLYHVSTVNGIACMVTALVDVCVCLRTRGFPRRTTCGVLFYSILDAYSRPACMIDAAHIPTDELLQC